METESDVQQLTNIWTGLDRRRQVMVIVTAVLVILTLVVMSRLAARPSMALLYAGLDGVAAGEVVRSLEQQGTAYEVRGDAIYVASRDRDSMRMTLAADGLPATGGRGYELLDTLSGFGTTSQMFDAAYWRAKEGELARTIVGSPHIAQARVHIANGSSNPFQRSVKPTASISVVPAAGPISAEQAQALRFLVASAIAGLEIADVAVIDANGKIVGASDETVAATGSQDRADALRDKVMRLVEARVGRGNAVVEVSVDTVTETESIRERRIDPNGRVAISTDTEERSNTSSENGGAVGVASNLPDGDGAAGNAGQAETSETRERINYEVSEVEREVLKTPGAVRRLTVAVLVNNLVSLGADGTAQTTPRLDTELEALRELVASAVGYDEARGDVITLKSMDLPAVAPDGTSAGTQMFDLDGIDMMRVAQLGILALVALGLGLFVVRPILTAQRPQLDTSGIPALDVSPLPIDGEINPEFSPQPMSIDVLNPGDTSLPAVTSGGESAVDRLRSLIEERQTETIEILRGWLEDEEKV